MRAMLLYEILLYNRLHDSMMQKNLDKRRVCVKQNAICNIGITLFILSKACPVSDGIES